MGRDEDFPKRLDLWRVRGGRPARTRRGRPPASTQPQMSFEDVDRFRLVDCGHSSECSLHAAKRNWPAWACVDQDTNLSCPRYRQDPDLTVDVRSVGRRKE